MEVLIGYLAPTAYNHASSETALQNKVKTLYALHLKML